MPDKTNAANTIGDLEEELYKCTYPLDKYYNSVGPLTRPMFYLQHITNSCETKFKVRTSND